MHAVDFFCGAGGLTRGLLNAGIEVVLGVDNDEQCRQTYELNNSPAKFLKTDIRTADTSIVRRHVGKIARKDLLFAACAPCQPFSKQRTSSRDASLSTLLLHFGRFIESYKPAYVFLENVPGMIRVPGYSTYRRFCKLIEGLGYVHDEAVIDAKSYGVPQTRRRFLMLASRVGRIEIPLATHGHGGLSYVTVRDAIERFPPIKAGETNVGIHNHRASELSDLNLERIANCQEDGGDRRSWPRRLVLNCHKNGHTGHTDVYGRMWWDKPAPALTGKCTSLSNGRYGHPEQNRAISLREAAALQSFGDKYVFYGLSKTHIAQQIGNAVPVKLAEAIGRQLLNPDPPRRAE